MKTSNSIELSIFMQGKWFRDHCEVIAAHPSKDVLDYFFSVSIIENYLSDKKIELTNLIVDWLKEYKKLLWTETGEPVVLDPLFFEILLEYDGNLKQFKRALATGKFSATQLNDIRKKLLLSGNFFNPKKRE